MSRKGSGEGGSGRSRCGSGRMARNKGKRGEREVIDILRPVIVEVYEAFGVQVPELKRNTMQADGGGADIYGLEWLSLEVKRQEQQGPAKLEQFWEQTLAQCGQHQTPVLFYRQNATPWKVRTLATLGGGAMGVVSCAATVDLPSFLKWFRARLYQELYMLGV